MGNVETMPKKKKKKMKMTLIKSGQSQLKFTHRFRIVLVLGMISLGVVGNIFPSETISNLKPTQNQHTTTTSHSGPFPPDIKSGASSGVALCGNQEMDAFFAGNGTSGLSWASAYRLLNLTFTDNGSITDGISILSTTRFLIIENCSILGFSTGIRLINASNIYIDSNSFVVVNLGVALYECSDIRIKSNQISSSDASIVIMESLNVYIKENNMESRIIPMFSRMEVNSWLETLYLDETNLINGFPVYFLNTSKLRSGDQFYDAGQLFLYHCSNYTLDLLKYPHLLFFEGMYACQNVSILHLNFWKDSQSPNKIRGFYIINCSQCHFGDEPNLNETRLNNHCFLHILNSLQISFTSMVFQSLITIENSSQINFYNNYFTNDIRLNFYNCTEINLWGNEFIANWDKFRDTLIFYENSSNIHLFRCNFESNTGDMILFSDCQQIIVEDCRFNNNSGHYCLYFAETNDCIEITNSTFINSECIATIRCDWVNNVSIYHNLFDKNTANIIFWEGRYTNVSLNKGTQGNYWGDYYQHSPLGGPDPNGLWWDSPYNVTDDIRDEYPYLLPWGEKKYVKVETKSLQIPGYFGGWLAVLCGIGVLMIGRQYWVKQIKSQ